MIYEKTIYFIGLLSGILSLIGLSIGINFLYTRAIIWGFVMLIFFVTLMTLSVLAKIHKDIKRLMNFLARDNLNKFLTKLEDMVKEDVKPKRKKRK